MNLSTNRFSTKRGTFPHGLPKGIGAGVAGGFASWLAGRNDYVGRPLNIASRLCSQCEAGYVLIEVGTLGLKQGWQTERITLNLKTYGNVEAWKLALGDQ